MIGEIERSLPFFSLCVLRASAVLSSQGVAGGPTGAARIPGGMFRFVGVAPRRNPDIVVAVLWEHGNGGFNSARLASQVLTAFINKQREREGNLQKVAAAPRPANPDDVPAGTGGLAPATPEAQ